MPYVISAAAEILFGLLYGFFLQDVLPAAATLPIGFCISFTLLAILRRGGTERLRTRIFTVVISSAVLMLLPVMTLLCVNPLFGEAVGEYDVIAEFVNGRAGGSVDFTTPDGRSGNAMLHDYSPFHFSVDGEDRFVEVGDRIRVREYRGIFGLPYYEFLGELR